MSDSDSGKTPKLCLYQYYVVHENGAKFKYLIKIMKKKCFFCMLLKADVRCSEVKKRKNSIFVRPYLSRVADPPTTVEKTGPVSKKTELFLHFILFFFNIWSKPWLF